MIVNVLLGLFLASSVIGDKPPEFTDADFDEKVKQKENTLIMFYAPWCGHCKRLKPSFEAAWNTLSVHSNIGMALVDCTTQTEVCGRFGISGYPTLKFFKNGEFAHDFDGGRDESGLVKYVLSRSKPPSMEITNAKQLNDLLEDAGARDIPLVVSFIKSKTDGLLDTHSKIASDMLGEFVFAHTHVPGIIEETGWKDNFVRLYRPKLLVTPMTDAYVDYLSDFDFGSTRNWLKKNAHGAIGYRSQSTQALFPRDDILLFYNNASLINYPKGVNYYRNRLTKYIRQMEMDESDLVFAYVFSDDFRYELDDLQHDTSAFPFVVLRSHGKKYKLDAFSEDSFLQFLESFKSNSLTPFLKSEPVPIEQTDPLVKVVGHTFESIVNDTSKDVFIMFHAPWCGHCKELMPKFQSVAEKLSTETSIVMATYDATANDIFPPFEVRGYPTLYFVPKSSKGAPQLYQGPREIDDLVKFVAKESTEELRGFDRQGNLKKGEL